MRAPLTLISLALPALLLAGPVSGQEGMIPPLAEALAGYRADRFLSDRAGLTSRLDLSGEPGAPGAAGPILDLAELHLAHGLWGEAGSLLGVLSPDALPSDQRDRLARMRLLIRLLDPVGAGAVTPPSRDPVPASWSDAALFRALSGTGSGPDLGLATDQVSAWPEPVRARALPLLLERALTQDSWADARALADQLRAPPDLSGSPADLFLQGAAAERGGLPDAALSAYERAGAGADLWAARARLAWAELALSSGLRGADEVRLSLDAARVRWRGGEVGYATHALLFEVTRDLRRPLAALDLLSDLRDRHPAEADRVATDEDRWRLVEDFYAQGEAGEVPFGTFYEAHQRLFRDLSTDPRYLDLAEGFAERLARAGALRLAAEEYRRALDTLEIQARSARELSPADWLDRVRLRLAELLIEAGDPAEADRLLEAPVREPAFGDRQERLRARAGHALRDWERVLTTWVPDPEPDHLRLIARAHHALGGWEESRRMHLRLLEEGPVAEAGDLSRLITASFRAGRIAEDEPLIRDRLGAEQGPLLDALLGRDAPRTPMRRAEIEARLDRTGTLLGAVGPETAPTAQR
jgi:hypothetical protein